MNASFATALDHFVQQAQELVDSYYSKHCPNSSRPLLVAETGRRYVRIVRVDGAHARSVYAFVDTTNGDILKAASWKAPAKGTRGSIYAARQCRLETLPQCWEAQVCYHVPGQEQGGNQGCGAEQ